MAKHMIYIFTNCTDPKREEEFNSWYTHIHLPDLKYAKGLISARRFFNLNPDSEAKYLAVYEFDTDGIQESLKSLLSLAYRSFENGRHIDCIQLVQDISAKWLFQFQEINSSTIKPMEFCNYPRRVPQKLKDFFDNDEKIE